MAFFIVQLGICYQRISEKRDNFSREFIKNLYEKSKDFYILAPK